MNEYLSSPGSIMTSIDIEPDQLTASDKFQQLLNEVRAEINICAKILTASSNHAPYVTGPILTTYRPDPYRPYVEGDKNGLIPEYSYNVRQWPIPGTPRSITNLGGALVGRDEEADYPYVIDIFDIDDEEELVQLRDGLRTLRYTRRQ
jgi:hypothetical protein